MLWALIESTWCKMLSNFGCAILFKINEKPYVCLDLFFKLCFFWCLKLFVKCYAKLLQNTVIRYFII